MNNRVDIGIWSELPVGSRWANEGISRIVGFLIEGAAEAATIRFKVFVPRGMRDAVRQDLAALNAQEHRDWEVVEPSDAFVANWSKRRNRGGRNDWIAMNAAFANTHVKVAGWINTFPHFAGARLLKGRKAAMLPDAIPFDFPIGWNYDHYWSENGEWTRWRTTARDTLADAQTVIAHSHHVARRHGAALLGLNPEIIKVIPHSPPDLAPILPFVQGRLKTPETRAKAAGILRDYAIQKGVGYLIGFPFEEVCFGLIATQDRVTKNVGRVAEVVRRMLRDNRTDFKLFTTASVNAGADWTLLPSVFLDRQFHRDIISLPDVPREVHAALMHCATVTIHPSFYEGIIGTLTFYESVSVGTPCIMAHGPHTAELLATSPELEPLVFDPYDIDALSALVGRVLSDPSSAVEIQRPTYERRRRTGWDQVATAYAVAAAGSAIEPHV